MFKVLKKVLLSSLSILAVSFLIWTTLILNPNLSYANHTEFDYVTVYHNEEIDERTKSVINDAVHIIKKSTLFNEEVSIDLCLNDDKLYPKLHPFAGGPLAYAFLDKAIMKNCTVDFENNEATTKWAANNYEFRKFDLTLLLAHEFTHNLQYAADKKYILFNTSYINWKLEGHAEYTCREYKNDGLLKKKIEYYLLEEKKEHNGIPVFELEDGTKQSLSYFKYSLVVQYLLEEQGLNFSQICKLEKDLDVVYNEMLEWSRG